MKNLIVQLYERIHNGKLCETLTKQNKIPLLFIDEFPYLKRDRDRESLFIQVIRQRYEKNSLIITSNLRIDKGDELFIGKPAVIEILSRQVHYAIS